MRKKDKKLRKNKELNYLFNKSIINNNAKYKIFCWVLIIVQL
jgi:hypothetical protein